MDQYIGKMLDNRYEILEVIGTGGMAVVYKARCHRLNRLVAIKILRDDLAQDAEFRRRFHDESQAVAMLSHPNIMAVYDVSKSSELEYIVMELIDGITLKQYMQKKGTPLNWREALHFITQIMKALSHAHSRGIIHRDIKPQNIMVLRDGSVKVTDFGIARLASAAQNTLTQEALGSVHYISPEQARGSRIDSRSDIYSAGVVLYEMLAGQLPFEGDTPVSVAIQHINSIPLPPRELNPDIPEALEAITMKAMAPNVDQRYEGADAMLSDLEEFRKNPSINFDYTPADLFTPADGTDEPTQVIDTGRRKITPPPQPQHRRGDDDDDEEERHDMPRKRRKHGGGLSVPMALAAILIFVVGIGIFLYVTFFSDLFLAPAAEHPVPSLAGRTVAEVMADTTVTDIFEIKEGEAVTSSTVPAGQIVTQSPEANTTARGDRPVITVNVSAGSETIPMPDLTNKEYREAMAALTKLGLNVATPVMEYSDVTPNYVIRTDPLPDVPLAPGQSVTLYISQGPEVKKVTMTTVTGLDLAAAEKAITDLKLTMGTVTPTESEEEPGVVVWQSVTTGTEVDEGTAVDLKVSAEPDDGEPDPSPSPSPDSGEQPPTQQPDGSPSPSPDVTPIPPSTPAISTTTSKSFPVEIPQDGEDIVQVRIDVGGSVQFNSPVQSSVFHEIRPNISGSGKQTVSVYFDDVFAYSKEVNFTE